MQEDGGAAGLVELEDRSVGIGLDLDLLAIGGLDGADDVILDNNAASLGVVDRDSVDLTLDGDDTRIKLRNEYSLLGVGYGDYDVLLIGVSLDEPVVSLLFGHCVCLCQNKIPKYLWKQKRLVYLGYPKSNATKHITFFFCCVHPAQRRT